MENSARRERCNPMPVSVRPSPPDRTGVKAKRG